MLEDAVNVLRASMKANGLTQISLFDGQLIGFARKKVDGEYISIEIAVDFERRKVQVTTIREPAKNTCRDRFKEVDYTETGYATVEDALKAILKYCSKLKNSGEGCEDDF